MANSLSVKISEDGRRNAIVTLVGVVDTADMNVVQAIPITGFTNNEPRQVFKGFKFARASYSVTPGLNVLLAWNSNSPELMCALAGSAEMDRQPEGGYVPNLLASGYEGSINLSTTGFVAGSKYTFTIGLRMTKVYRR